MSVPMPGPRPGPPVGPEIVDLGADDDMEIAAEYSSLLPDPTALEDLPTREHVAIFEDLQNRLSEHLDDSES